MFLFLEGEVREMADWLEKSTAGPVVPRPTAQRESPRFDREHPM